MLVAILVRLHFVIAFTAPRSTRVTPNLEQRPAMNAKIKRNCFCTRK